ncbi:endolytic transglycosylase MltG [uncultured Desulfuromusa sp.]|uniref:endolytic transglycosylase MltG n=1 Tax=uncultured Desulfuromusa sp. TaxID=219183 RepID=UPI002AA6BD2F|nr:endolytic transglycosylase MltG [uncultured Desulfuromusa sp.]
MRRYFLWFVSFVILLIPALAFIFYAFLFSPQSPEKLVQIQIQSGTGLNKVASELQATGVIRSALALKLLARWNHQSGKIQAGNYQFKNPASPREILDRLIQGDVEKVSLTIPEGFTLQQIIARMAEKGFGKQEKLSKLVYDTNFIQSLGINAESLEGYLFPETYLFAEGIDEKALLKMMVTQFRSYVDSELMRDAEKLGLTLHQWLTLASIIEKETGIVAEMPLISSVFHNRLKRDIPLQTDPTVIYGIKDFDGNITRKHLQTPTPYNTYLNRGLPPGPIASPGLAALQAAVHPAETNFLYFVARGDGGHTFSKTLKEHNIAVREYLKQRRRK